MFGVSYHWYGSDCDTGMRPRRICSRLRQWAKFGKVTMPRGRRAASRDDRLVLRIACSVCDRIT